MGGFRDSRSERKDQQSIGFVDGMSAITGARVRHLQCEERLFSCLRNNSSDNEYSSLGSRIVFAVLETEEGRG